jgi:hypothetical protein
VSFRTARATQRNPVLKNKKKKKKSSRKKTVVVAMPYSLKSLQFLLEMEKAQKNQL